MKRAWLLMVVVLLLAAVVLPGCRGVILSPTYSDLLNRTAVAAAAEAARANAGGMDANEMRAVIKWNSEAWQLFRDARDGIDSTKPR